jgi:hypothetical protein
MNNTERMTIKKELREIAKSKTKFDKNLYDYYLNNIKKIGFTDREIGYLIFDILYGYRYYTNDYEIKIVDFLFNLSSLKSHSKFNELYINSFGNYSIVTFELLLKHNVHIEQWVIETAEVFLNSIELGFYSDTTEEIEDFSSRIITLKQSARKQKIEKIRNEIRTKNKMINYQIINQLLLNKTTCN